MLVELGTFGVAAGLLMKFISTKILYADLYISLVSAMLIGRIVAGISRALIFSPGAYSMTAWTTAYFVTSLPGIILQLAIIPSIYYALERAKLIPRRY
jgi:hypothetical protein